MRRPCRPAASAGRRAGSPPRSPGRAVPGGSWPPGARSQRRDGLLERGVRGLAGPVLAQQPGVQTPEVVAALVDRAVAPGEVEETAQLEGRGVALERGDRLPDALA